LAGANGFPDGPGEQVMTYEDFFANAIARLRDERRHRVFANLERIAMRCYSACNFDPL